MGNAPLGCEGKKTCSPAACTALITPTPTADEWQPMSLSMDEVEKINPWTTLRGTKEPPQHFAAFSPHGPIIADKFAGEAPKEPKAVRPAKPAKEQAKDHYEEGLAYWEQRYEKTPKPADWVLKPDELQGVLERFVGNDNEQRILHVGCGNSLLPEQIYDSGCEQVVNVDTSTVVIDQMRDRNAELRPRMEWHVMDVAAMTFPNEHFELVIDKALLDTILCESNEPQKAVAAYLQEVARVMTSRAVHLVVTFGPPDSHLQYLSGPPCNFQIETIEVPSKSTKTPKCQWVYACRKAA